MRHATGLAKADSDLDLVIVKQTPERPIDRRIEVERLLADRAMALDLLVYTPREMWELYSAGDPFMEEVLGRGKVVYMRRATAAWLRDAKDEIESAQLLAQHGKARGACLHSQQCVEKALKALLLERGETPPRTHVELLRLAGRDTGLTRTMPSFSTASTARDTRPRPGCSRTASQTTRTRGGPSGLRRR